MSGGKVYCGGNVRWDGRCDSCGHQQSKTGAFGLAACDNLVPRRVETIGRACVACPEKDKRVERLRSLLAQADAWLRDPPRSDAERTILEGFKLELREELAKTD